VLRLDKAVDVKVKINTHKACAQQEAHNLNAPATLGFPE
jgi:hypothetical protein